MGDKRDIWGRVTPFTGTSRSFSVESAGPRRPFGEPDQKEYHWQQQQEQQEQEELDSQQQQQQELHSQQQQEHGHDLPTLQYIVAADDEVIKWWRGEGSCAGFSMNSHRWYVFDACVWGPEGFSQWRRGVVVLAAHFFAVVAVVGLVLAAGRAWGSVHLLQKQQQDGQQQQQQQQLT